MSAMVGRYVAWGPCGGACKKRQHRLFRVRHGLLRDGQKAFDILGASGRPSASNT
jgi:hypothetical protein